MAFNSTTSLVFSKTATNNLPITQTRTEHKPCADSLYQSLSPGQTYFYPTEYNDVGCEVEKNTGKINDERYMHSGLGTN